jgi:hypothetical protein
MARLAPANVTAKKAAAMSFLRNMHRSSQIPRAPASDSLADYKTLKSR